MPIGNDVVDLRDPEARPGAVHARFDRRVFTPEERACLASAPHSGPIRWSLWAAKESAFKAARKLDPGVPFHPRRFVVRALTEARAGRVEVVHRTVGRFAVWWRETHEWIHAAAAALEGEIRPPRWTLSFLNGEGAFGGDPSRGVRELARRTLAPVLDLCPSELEIELHDGIPRLWRGGEPLPVDISLSHHGRLLAFAWRPAT